LARAQNPANVPQQPDTATFRANVRQVLVPVVVTDQKGHYVADLNASDFTLLEDGVPQDLVAVSSSTDPTDATLLKNAPSFRDTRPPLAGLTMPRSLRHCFYDYGLSALDPGRRNRIQLTRLYHA
jgi:hypothetical protein